MILTMKMAKADFFVLDAFRKPVGNAKTKILSKFGAYCMRDARKSIKDGGKPLIGRQHSKHPNPPLDHGKYRGSIVFVHDKVLDEVVIGAVLFPNKSNNTLVPQVLEYGGYVEGIVNIGTRRAYKTWFQQSRPHMRPAFNRTIKKLLPDLIANSIVPTGYKMLELQDGEG